MSDNKTINITPVDALVSDDSLQILKACIPFFGIREQSLILAFTKFTEFRRSIKLVKEDSGRLQACSVNPQLRTPLYMLNHVRPYCSEHNRHTIDTLLQYFQMLQMYQSMNDPSFMPEAFLNEEQRELFRQFSNTVQNLQETEDELYDQ